VQLWSISTPSSTNFRALTVFMTYIPTFYYFSLYKNIKCKAHRYIILVSVIILNRSTSIDVGYEIFVRLFVCLFVCGYFLCICSTNIQLTINRFISFKNSKFRETYFIYSLISVPVEYFMNYLSIFRFRLHLAEN